MAWIKKRDIAAHIIYSFLRIIIFMSSVYQPTHSSRARKTAAEGQRGWRWGRRRRRVEGEVWGMVRGMERAERGREGGATLGNGERRSGCWPGCMYGGVEVWGKYSENTRLLGEKEERNGGKRKKRFEMRKEKERKEEGKEKKRKERGGKAGEG